MTSSPLRIMSLAIHSLLGSAMAASPQETPEERLAQLALIRLSPIKYVGYQQQKVSFSALGLDLSGKAVNGIKFSFQSSDTTKVDIDEAGLATFLQPGLVWITCQAGNIQARAPVYVKAGSRPRQTDAQWLADQNTLAVDGTITVGSNRSDSSTGSVASLFEKLTLTAYAQSCGSGGDGGDFVYNEIWSEPRNLLGSPRNRAAEPTRMGLVLPEGSNFNFGMPVINLGGRGIGAGLTLYYNSRIWSRHGNAVTFNAVNGWPYAGFSLGFGRVITYGSDPSVSYLLVDADGTRHLLGVAPSSGYNSLETSDGTHIQYFGNATYGELRYPDGTRVAIGLYNNRLLPTQITDRNGNYIQIAYKYFFPWNQAIDYVRDTLGRYIQFNYDACSNLVSITAPAFGSGIRTLAQFDYQSRSLTFSFSGLTVENASYGQTLNTLRHVYFPATQTGYLFSYSDYGMMYNASLRRQMSIDQFGAIRDGVESANASFNYPTSGATVSTDAPAFTQRTESPGGTYSYATSTGSGTMTFTITRPDASQLLLTRSTNGASTDNGLLVQSEVKNGSGASQAKNVFTYVADPFGSPQVQSVTTYDDIGTPTKVDFDYDRTGAVINRREYGFQVSGTWQVRRRTQFNYLSDSAYFVANLWRLVSSVIVYDAQLNTNDSDDVQVAQTNFTYDNYAAMGGMLDYWNSSSAPGHVSSYDTNKTVRGNITGITEYKDVFGSTITRLAKFDVFGNLVKAQVTCCNQKNYTFDVSNYWSQPIQLTDGDPTGIHLTGTVAYDFNTSLVTSQTDPNNLITSYSYDGALRLHTKILPTGATVTATYNDAQLTASTTMNYVEGGQNRSITSSAVYNGWGQPAQKTDAASNQVNIAYDSMQRVCAQTNPFAQGGQPGPSTTYQYDALGRLGLTTLADGVNTVQYTYSGTTRTVTDQVNRQIKQETDGLGRITKVTEKDTNGQLTQETNYTYNMIDKLTDVNQGGQLRAFKYDALGRLLFERIPEQSATINDGTGTFWSSKYTWTDFHAINQKQDARGAITSYGYDALNRLTSVSYDTSNAPGVAATPNVTYNYDTSSNSTTKGLLLSVNVGTSYSESYGFDSVNRVSSVTQIIDGRAYTTSYQFNTASQHTQRTYPSGRVVNMSRDSMGRLSSLVDGAGPTYLSAITYNAAEQIKAFTLGNGVSESLTYDANLLQMTSQSATRGGSTLLSLNYSYSALAGQNGGGSTAGNAAQLMSVSGTINGATESASFTYDLMGRLATSSQSSNGASAQRRFAYDRWGNRTQVMDALSGGNQIQTISYEQNAGVPTNRIQSVNPSKTNVASAANGASATASTTYGAGYEASGVINGDRKGLNWGAGGGWNDGNASQYPDWVQVNFNGSKTIDEVSVFTIQDNYSNPTEPTEDQTFNLYGITDYQVQYWDGAVWQTIPGASVAGNNKVWRRFTFSQITTDKIRVYITGALGSYSRVTEVEAYQATTAANNVALAANGASATASSTFSSGYDPSGTINGDRKGLNWGNGGGWNDATLNSYPDWVQVNFNGSKHINEIDVFTLQDNFSNPQEPTEQMTFSLYGIRDFQVQYWDGTAWQTVANGSVTGNNKVWRKFTFPEVSTDKIRVYITGTADGYSRITEIEAYRSPITYSYDAAGNLTNDGVHSYQYDAMSRLVNIDNGSTAQYSYDHRNWRVKKAVGSAVTHYVWEGGRVLAEHDGASGAAIVEYIRLAGAMIAKVQSGSTQYLLSDRQSIRMILDSSGNVIGRQAHLPFGEDFAESGTQERHHFTSYERDAESSLDYAVNRFHNFSVGRFTSADRASGHPANPQSWNRYSFGKNDPVNRSDAAGLDDDVPEFDGSVDDILAMLDGGGGGGDDYAFDEFLEVFAGQQQTITPIPPDQSLLQPFPQTNLFPGPPLIPPIPSGLSPIPGTPFDLSRVPVPNMLPAPVPQAYQDLLREAIAVAVSALENPECASLFKNLPAGVHPADLLIQLYLEGDITFGYGSDPNVGANTSEVTHQVVTDASGQPIYSAVYTAGVPHIEINSNPQSAFISGNYPNTGLTPTQNRTVTLIHELGHAANKLYGPFGGAVSDLDTPPSNPIFAFANRLNSARIRRRCF